MATINSFYHQHAMEYATISEDGMVVTMPSEKKDNVFYNVICKETAHGIEAVDCQCRGFSRYHACKHLTIVNEWLEAQAPTPVEPKITEIEPNAWYIVNSDSQVWRDADSGQWLAAGLTANAIEIVEAHLAVKTAEQIVAAPVVTMPTPEVVASIESDEHTTVPVTVAASDSKKLANILAAQKADLGLVGNLNVSRGFQMLR